MKDQHDKRIPGYIRKLYSNFGKYLYDFLRSAKIDKSFVDKFVTIKGLEYIDEALSKGKGVIGLTAHIGNWELAAQVLALLGYKMNAIALIHENKFVDKIFTRHRRASGMKVIPVGMSVRECFKALKKNEIVGIIGDRDFSGENGIFLKFFDRQLLVPRGPAVLSLKTGAAIVPGFVVRDEKDDRYFTYTFEKPIYPENTGDDEQDIINISEQFIRIIESYVQKYPQQWSMFREFWNPEKAKII